jgi:hypothetical protein
MSVFVCGVAGRGGHATDIGVAGGERGGWQFVSGGAGLELFAAAAPHRRNGGPAADGSFCWLPEGTNGSGLSFSWLMRIAQVFNAIETVHTIGVDWRAIDPATLQEAPAEEFAARGEQMLQLIYGRYEETAAIVACLCEIFGGLLWAQAMPTAEEAPARVPYGSRAVRGGIWLRQSAGPTGIVVSCAKRSRGWLGFPARCLT